MTNDDFKDELHAVAAATDFIKNLNKNDVEMFAKTSAQFMAENDKIAKELRHAVSQFDNLFTLKGLEVGHPDYKILTQDFPDMPLNPVYETNEKLDNIASKFDAAQPIISAMANLIENLNSTTVTFLAEFKKANDEATMWQRWTMGIAILAIILSTGFSIYSVIQEVENSKQTQRMTNNIIRKMEESSQQNIHFENELLNALNKNIEDQNVAAKENAEILNNLRKEEVEVIRSLADSVKQQSIKLQDYLIQINKVPSKGTHN